MVNYQVAFASSSQFSADHFDTFGQVHSKIGDFRLKNQGLVALGLG